MRHAAPSLDAGGLPAGRPVRSSGNAGGGPWRQPVVWLGVAILLSSLVGCALMIWLATRYPDVPMTGGVDAILRMPTQRGDAPTDAPSAAPSAAPVAIPASPTRSAPP